MAAKATEISRRPRRRLGTVADAAAVLACSVDTVDRLIRSRRLSIIRLPTGSRRVDLDELDKLIDCWKSESMADWNDR